LFCLRPYTPTRLLTGYGIIGVEETVVEVEAPFGRNFNSAPISAITGDTHQVICDFVRMVREARMEAAAAAGPGCDGGKLAADAVGMEDGK